MASELDFGDDTSAVLEALKAEGYAASGNEVYVSYEDGADPYIGIEAAHLQERIFDVAPVCTSRDLSNADLMQGLTYLWGLGA